MCSRGCVAASRAAWAIAEEDGCPFKLVVMNPTLVIGPALQPKLNTSIAVFMKLVKDDDNTNRCLVDVRCENHVMRDNARRA